MAARAGAGARTHHQSERGRGWACQSGARAVAAVAAAVGSNAAGSGCRGAHVFHNLVQRFGLWQHCIETGTGAMEAGGCARGVSVTAVVGARGHHSSDGGWR